MFQTESQKEASRTEAIEERMALLARAEHGCKQIVRLSCRCHREGRSLIAGLDEPMSYKAGMCCLVVSS